MSPKRYSETYNDGDKLVKVACTKVHPCVWNLAIVSARSTRECNDFIYGRYRRRSCVRLLGQRQRVSFRTLIQANKFVRRMIATLPEGHWIKSRPDWDEVEALSKWMRRMGFKAYDMDGVLTYFLKVPRREGALCHSQSCSEAAS